MKHYPFNPTPEQRANLLRLATHLDLGVTNLEFDMKNFDSPCGTIGCAAGHGPSLGIKRLEGEDWYGYSDRVFGTDFFLFTDSVYDWLFSSDWAFADNTPRGAASRIHYALQSGIPKNLEDQIDGKAPLSYTVEPRVEAPAISIPAMEPAQ